MGAFHRMVKSIIDKYLGLIVALGTIALVLFAGLVVLPFCMAYVHRSSSQSSDSGQGPNPTQTFGGRPKGQKSAFKRPGPQDEGKSGAGQKKLAESREKKQNVADSKATEAKQISRDPSAILEHGKELLAAGKNDQAAEQFKKVISDYPDTAAAKEAAELLKKIQ
jgi:hypothetical protein